MEYSDDNCISISCFPLYVRESKVKEKHPFTNLVLFDFPFYRTNPGPVSFGERNWAWVFFFSEKNLKNFLFLKPGELFFRLGGVKGAKNTV